ncbi:MAG: factor-independent urate hydroxylase [Acidimicrobiia bacterium]
MLGPNRYGKSAVRVVKVLDGGGIADLTVGILCEGDFALVHTHGDNAAVVATDTMKNTIYALAQDRLGHEAERFARVLAAHFREFPQVTGTEVRIEERLWAPIGSHPHAFAPTGTERRLAGVTAGTMGNAVEAGIRGLMMLKTTGSSFSGFTRDRYTTLSDAEDRLLATEVTAHWRYHTHVTDYTEVWRSVRRILMEDFAARPSRSAQEQGYGMGRAVLDAHPEIEEITMSMPNNHHLAVDLTRFEMEDRGVVFQPVDEPYGDIRVTVRRR